MNTFISDSICTAISRAFTFLRRPSHRASSSPRTRGGRRRCGRPRPWRMRRGTPRPTWWGRRRPRAGTARRRGVQSSTSTKTAFAFFHPRSGRFHHCRFLDLTFRLSLWGIPCSLALCPIFSRLCPALLDGLWRRLVVVMTLRLESAVPSLLRCMPPTLRRIPDAACVSCYAPILPPLSGRHAGTRGPSYRRADGFGFSGCISRQASAM